VALLEDRPICVFDEWAADQDPEFRAYFYEELLPTLKQRGKTVIAVTHDDRFFHCADQVITMEYGRIRSVERAAPKAPVEREAGVGRRHGQELQRADCRAEKEPARELTIRSMG